VRGYEIKFFVVAAKTNIYIYIYKQKQNTFLLSVRVVIGYANFHGYSARLISTVTKHGYLARLLSTVT
jgi:hypothetical protein